MKVLNEIRKTDVKWSLHENLQVHTEQNLIRAKILQ